MEKPLPGDPETLLAVYDQDTRGPHGDFQKARAGEDPNGLSKEEVLHSDKWDWVCGKRTLDKWVNEEVKNRTDKIGLLQWIALILALVGALLHIAFII